ncbi:MAG TPA: GNAT family N-acetyltransferase [Lachnospiraceae bacterium]|nr:GNAT family N-acetyltransferase [Lachnospiraceae bacterium]
MHFYAGCGKCMNAERRNYAHEAEKCILCMEAKNESVGGDDKIMVNPPGMGYNLKEVFDEMKLSVRRASQADAGRIKDLLTQVEEVHHQGRPDIFLDGAKKYNDGQLSIIIEDDCRPVFVAVDEDGYVCGYSFCVISQPDGSSMLSPIKTLYIDDLCVDEKMRGRGVGQLLYNYVKQYAKEAGCYHLTLNVWACNPAAMKFYEKQGMQMLKKEMEIIL